MGSCDQSFLVTLPDTPVKRGWAATATARASGKKPRTWDAGRSGATHAPYGLYNAPVVWTVFHSMEMSIT
jgi:hypothetical protein